MHILERRPAPIGPIAIAALNDELRHRLAVTSNSRILMTCGIDALCGQRTTTCGWYRYAELLGIIRDYDDFGERNESYGERDFGAFIFAYVKCFWKIDYYDAALTGGSAHPADPEATTRILTVMRADEC
jgi:hypothetical protein